jgi:glycosyltransferase involved in cell wall biosynthesis
MERPLSEPLVTIGITCYREGEWLRECWQSVLAQTDSRWCAVLVMDGGADDATRAVFAELAHERLHKEAFEENGGAYRVRNRAVELTQTPYHLYLDADDRLRPNTVALALAAFEAEPELGAVVGDWQGFGDSHWRVRRPRRADADHIAENGMGGGGAMYRCDIWREYGGFAAGSDLLAKSGGDIDFNVGILAAGYEICGLGEVTYDVRWRQTSNSKRHRRDIVAQHEEIMRRHPNMWPTAAAQRRFLAIAYRWLLSHLLRHEDYAAAGRCARAMLRRRCWDGNLGACVVAGLLPARLLPLARSARHRLRGG